MEERLQNSVGALGDAGEIMALQDSLETAVPGSGSEPEPEYDWKEEDEIVD
jgi:hypothetical protein